MGRTGAWIRGLLAGTVVVATAVVVADAARTTFTLGVVAPAPVSRTVLAAVVDPGDGGATASTSVSALEEAVPGDPDAADGPDGGDGAGDGPDRRDVEVTVDEGADGAVVLVVCGGLADGDLVVRIGAVADPVAVAAVVPPACPTVTLDLRSGSVSGDGSVVLHLTVPTPAGPVVLEVVVPGQGTATEEATEEVPARGAEPTDDPSPAGSDADPTPDPASVPGPDPALG